jgi:regulator of protease activity HflC (stomatin/prohibitin superfamily)
MLWHLRWRYANTTDDIIIDCHEQQTTSTTTTTTMTTTTTTATATTRTTRTTATPLQDHLTQDNNITLLKLVWEFKQYVVHSAATTLTANKQTPNTIKQATKP